MTVPTPGGTIPPAFGGTDVSTGFAGATAVTDLTGRYLPCSGGGLDKGEISAAKLLEAITVVCDALPVVRAVLLAPPPPTDGAYVLSLVVDGPLNILSWQPAPTTP